MKNTKKTILCICIAFTLLSGVIFAAASCGSNTPEPAMTDDPGPVLEDDPEPEEQTQAKTEKPKATEGDKKTEKSTKPTLIGSTFLDKERYCIAGKAAEHAVITIEGALYPAESKAIGGLFVTEVFLEKQKTKDVELRVYAKNAGRDISDPLVIKISKDESRDSVPVYVGKKNHLQYEHTLDDYLGTGLFSESELADLRKGAEKLQKKLRDAGLKTELIVFIAPNPATIYPENMPDYLAERKVSDDSRAKQIVRAFEGSEVKVIFPYQRLLREKLNNTLYYWADTHWNEVGAYFGYCELFEYIGQKFPDAKPLPEDEINIFESTTYGGDIVSNMLFFDSGSYPYTTSFARVKNPRAVQKSLVGDPGMGAETWVREDGRDRPSVVMYRDSFSVAMLAFIAESSSQFIVNPMWDFSVNMELLKKEKPDYLIIEKVERESRGFSGVLR